MTLRKQVHYRLLVVRLGAMGDVLHALPAITALRKAHPTWKIDWAIEPHWVPLLSALPEDGKTDGKTEGRTAAQPVVDRIHRVPSKAWGKKPLSLETWNEVGRLRTELRLAEYDAVLDVQGAIRSAVVAKMTGSRRVIGDAAPRETPARWAYTERVETVGLHVIERNMELASAVAGDLLTAMAPTLPVDAAAEAWCEGKEEIQAALRRASPIVLIHPGAGWGAKRWPAERYGAVAEEFGRRGALVLVNAGPGEVELASAVVAASGGLASVVISTLGQLIELTRRVSLVIGGDTGPIHLACALEKPVVGIYGPTDPKRNGPYGTKFRVLRNPESRRDHTRRQEPEAGLLTIMPEDVVEAALDLMAAERPGRAENSDPEWPGGSIRGEGWTAHSDWEAPRP